MRQTIFVDKRCSTFTEFKWDTNNEVLKYIKIFNTQISFSQKVKNATFMIKNTVTYKRYGLYLDGFVCIGTAKLQRIKWYWNFFYLDKSLNPVLPNMVLEINRTPPRQFGKLFHKTYQQFTEAKDIATFEKFSLVRLKRYKNYVLPALFKDGNMYLVNITADYASITQKGIELKSKAEVITHKNAYDCKLPEGDIYSVVDAHSHLILYIYKFGEKFSHIVKGSKVITVDKVPSVHGLVTPPSDCNYVFASPNTEPVFKTGDVFWILKDGKPHELGVDENCECVLYAKDSVIYEDYWEKTYPF